MTERTRPIVQRLYDILDAHVKGGGLILWRGEPYDCIRWNEGDLELGLWTVYPNKARFAWIHDNSADAGLSDAVIIAEWNAQLDLLDRRPLNLDPGEQAPFTVIEHEGTYSVAATGLGRAGLIDLVTAIRRILKPGKTVAMPKDDGAWLKGDSK